jgi:DNA-3-methyladenine glycosylase I
MKRCQWVGNDPLMISYHDKEWGVPLNNDQKWFEFIVLDSFQAGLSWKTILHKREGFRKAFFNFDVIKVSKMEESRMLELMEDKSIIRNKLKIRSTVSNAKAFIAIQKEFESFNKYIWSFVDNKTIKNVTKQMSDLPAKTDLSDKISSDLKKRGFKFMGSTISYALLQASGIINDHTTDCFRYNKV